MRDLIWVAIGGACGALARHGLTMGARQMWGESFPWGTLAVNLIGCLLLGMLAEASIRWGTIPTWQQRGAGIGFLGALTTFSTFGHDTFRLWELGRRDAALVNVASNLVLGLAAVALGVALVRARA